jgi:hypothetical protein
MRAPALVLSVLLVVALLVLSSGCITEYKKLTAPKPTPTPTPTPAPVITPPITIDPTPIPEATLIPANDTFTWGGPRALGDWFTWRRDNVLGYKDLFVRVTVYGYKEMDNYTWWSIDWGKWFFQYPPQGNKFIFAFVHMEMTSPDGDQAGNTSWDPRMWGLDSNYFRLQAGSTLYDRDDSYQPPTIIKELQFTNVMDNSTKIGMYGYQTYSYVHSLTEEPKPYPLYYLRGGKSNAWDGFILYDVPADVSPENMAVVSNFGTFGSAYWNLA